MPSRAPTGTNAEKRKKEKLKPRSGQAASEKRLSNSKAQKTAKAIVNEMKSADSQLPGHRKVTEKIAKNRGLVQHRKKEDKNPRLRLRRRFAKAMKKHMHKTKKVKAGTRLPTVESYDGEATGINKRAVRSISLV